MERRATACCGSRSSPERGPPGKKLPSPAARRWAAQRLMAGRGFSQRHACRLVDVDPKTVRRVPPADASEIRQRLCALVSERRRFGYSVLLARDHDEPQEALSAYREEGVTVRRRCGRKRRPARAHRSRSRRDRPALVARRRHRRALLRPAVPGPGDRGRLHVRGAHPGRRQLDRQSAGRARIRRCDRPTRLTGDHRQQQRHRAELASRAGMDQPDLWHCIALGKPTQDAFVESFIGRFRDERLNEESSPAWPRLMLSSSAIAVSG